VIEDKSGAALAWMLSLPSIVMPSAVARRRDGATGLGTMSHDKVRAAARKRMAKTGEPYTTARRAVVSEHQAAGAGSPPPGASYVLRMSGEIHDWLADLRRRDQPAAVRVVRALVTLMTEGAGLGVPLVVSAAGSWPWALAEALDRSYQERLDRLTALRRGEADAVTLVDDIQDQVAELVAAQATLEELRRQALDAGRPQEAAQAAGKLAAVQQQAAEVRRLLTRMIGARNRLREQNEQVQARVEAFRTRKETLKARHAAIRGSLQARQAIEALNLAGDDGGQHPESSGEAARAEAAELADITAQMERELGQEARPEGLMEPKARRAVARRYPDPVRRRASRRRAADRGAGRTRSGHGAIPRSGHGIGGHAAPGQGWPGARGSGAYL
jgi:hypothetical protein